MPGRRGHRPSAPCAPTPSSSAPVIGWRSPSSPAARPWPGPKRAAAMPRRCSSPRPWWPACAGRSPPPPMPLAATGSSNCFPASSPGPCPRAPAGGRRHLKQDLAALRKEAAAYLGIDRWNRCHWPGRPSQFVTLAATFFGLWLLVQQFVGFGEIAPVLAAASWWWVAATLVITQTTAVSEAVAMSGAVPAPDPRSARSPAHGHVVHRADRWDRRQNGHGGALLPAARPGPHRGRQLGPDLQRGRLLRPGHPQRYGPDLRWR